MTSFGPATRRWFESAFEAPTPVQTRGWAEIAEGKHSLLIAPTGSGKTLAAFLWCIDRLAALPPTSDPEGVRVLYVSPLKALVYDVERNLRAPLVGIANAAEVLGTTIRVPKVAVRTGDTPTKERQQQLRAPSDILVTTPESLYLMLASQVRKHLASVTTVIVDEVHALVPGKRGAHLSVSLERLAHLCGQDPQRIGLSATARPLDEVARFLGGDRAVSIVDASARPSLDLRIVVPVPDMTRPSESLALATAREAESAPSPPDSLPPAPPVAVEDLAVADPVDPVDPADDDDDVDFDEGDIDAEGRTAFDLADDARSRHVALQGRPEAPIAPAPAPPGTFEPTDNSIWPAVYPRLLELIAAHRTTIIFVNSRGLCERLAQRLSELAQDADLVRAHHGSIARAHREQIEEMLKSGRIKAIVATSSLELGIDMGTVDLVVLVESPGAVSRGLQRVGRAGHGVGEVSRGRIFPKHRGDLLETVVVTERMLAGEIESIAYPRNPLDVLAQHVVAMCSAEDWKLGDLEKVIRRSANFRDVPRDALVGVIDMLSGRYPSHAFADLRPRINWNRDDDVLSARRGAKQIAVQSGGTIPDRGTYSVHLGEGGPRVGELDEEMVHESASGQNIMLGATTWKIQQITRDRVIVSPAPGESGKLPFWRGDGPGRPAELGRAMGRFVAEIGRRRVDAAETWLQKEHRLDAWAAQNLVAYVREQREATDVLPSDRTIVVERFRDELGDWRLCIHSLLGSRVNAPWALAIQARLEAACGFEVQVLWSDDGIVLRLVDTDELPELDLLLPDPEDIEERIVDQLAHSALFAGQFRENAARALLLPRPRAQGRMPLWQQRLKAQQLLGVAREYPSFPIIIETYRACMRDIFDLPALIELLHEIRRRDVRIEVVETPSPSPFARSLVFAYVAAYLYEGDAPLAERKAQALALDRKLLRELLGREELRELLDSAAIDELEADLQGLSDDRRARHVDGLHDLLRRVGDLSRDELRVRCEGDSTVWADELVQQRRAVWTRVAGQERLLAIEDVAIYRDALGCQPPPGVPRAFLTAEPNAWPVLVERYARTHAPFGAQAVALRFGVPIGQVMSALRELEAREVVMRGEFRPGGVDEEWCDLEVLRRIKRRTLARLRGEIAPVEARALGRFLPAWHGIGESRIGQGRLEEVLARLEGLPLSYDELEGVILPARVPGFAPRMLDELGALGWLVWIGHGSLGKHDGRVALYRRERVAALVEPPAVPADLQPLHRRVLEHLQARGACFFVELSSACGSEVRVPELADALWDLCWAGLVTNDTFAALRGHATPQKPKRGLRGGSSFGGAVGGRWSLVADLARGEVSPTERAHARAVTLLERHGIVSREVAGLEVLPGGFSAVYKVLRAMEESGRIRRGYFVEDLGGAQFASPGAVDRLRAVRSEGEREVVVLSAVDPANPYGWLLPWPARDDGSSSGPRRVAGATVVLVDGELTLYLDKGDKRLLTFKGADDPDAMIEAARALTSVARRRRGKILRIEKIDGEPARTSPQAERLRAAAFVSDPRGLLLEAK